MKLDQKDEIIPEF